MLYELILIIEIEQRAKIIFLSVGDAGLKMLSALKDDPHYKLETLM